MAENKTKPTEQGVEQFLEGVSDAQRRQDCYTVLKLMQEVTGETPKMWGSAIIGFGTYRYRYKSGREGEWFAAGFSPRKQNLTLYLATGFEARDELMQALGKYTHGKSCLYVKRLSDINLEALRELIKASANHVASVSV